MLSQCAAIHQKICSVCVCCRICNDLDVAYFSLEDFQKPVRAVPELTIWGGWAAAFLFFYAWSGSTEFVFNAWWGFQNNLFYTWSVFPEGTRKYLCGGASFRPIVLDRNVN